MASAARLSAGETAAAVADVVAPLLARGVIARRPRVVDVLDRLDADSPAVRRLQRLRARHGAGPLALAVPGRNFALVLDPGDARRVFAQSPDPVHHEAEAFLAKVSAEADELAEHVVASGSSAGTASR